MSDETSSGIGLGTIAAIAAGGLFVYLLATSGDDRERMRRELVRRGLRGKELSDALDAIDLASEIDWSGKHAEVIPFRHPKPPKKLAKLGKAVAIIYESKKSGKSKKYLHEFDDPHPVLGVHPKGKQLYLVGGRYHVNHRGIVH